MSLSPCFELLIREPMRATRAHHTHLCAVVSWHRAWHGALLEEPRWWPSLVSGSRSFVHGWRLWALHLRPLLVDGGAAWTEEAWGLVGPDR